MPSIKDLAAQSAQPDTDQSQPPGRTQHGADPAPPGPEDSPTHDPAESAPPPGENAEEGAAPPTTDDQDRYVIGERDFSHYGLDQDDLEYLRRGWQRQADYTKKTQRLADERRELEAARQKAAQYDSIQELLGRTPEALEALARAAAGRPANGSTSFSNGAQSGNGTENLPPNWAEMDQAQQFRTLRDSIASSVTRDLGSVLSEQIGSILDQRLGPIEQDTRTTREARDLVARYPELQGKSQDDPIWQEVIQIRDQYAERGVPLSLTQAYREHMADHWREQALEHTRAQNSRRTTAASISRPGRAPEGQEELPFESGLDQRKQWARIKDYTLNRLHNAT